MISERELLKEIAICEKEPLNYSKIEKLANLYIVYDHLYKDDYYLDYIANMNQKQVINTNNESEFMRIMNDKNIDDVLPILDELVTGTLQVINPKLYNALLRKIKDL